MLIEFRVKNYGCLRDEQVLSLVPVSNESALLDNNTYETGVTAVPRLLRTAVIYGPNAGGKSTVLRALQCMLAMVLFSANEIKEKEFPTPFLLDNISFAEPTAFEINFLHEGKRYQYGFSCQPRCIMEGRLQKGQILQEYLLEYKSGRPTTLFKRSCNTENDTESYTFGKTLRGHKTAWRDATQNNVLFLSRAAQLNSEQLSSLYKNFFASSFIFNKNTDIPKNFFLQKIKNDEKLKNNIVSFLQSADISLKDIHIKEEIEGHKDDTIKKHVSFIHSSQHGDVSLPDYVESGGTMKLFEHLLPLLLLALDQGSLLAIDELDSSLHPLLVRRIVEIFQSPQTNPKGAQLIFTTHDTSLLQDSEILFRRDQIWFVEKNAEQASELYSLAEFKAPKGEDFSLAYLQGLYGGIPLMRDWEAS